MGNFKPSAYQQAIYDFMANENGNAVIDAVAGSGKSTTIVNALKLISPNTSVLFLAFNKSIVEELKIKVGNIPNVDIRTLHSLGCSVMFKTFNSKIDDAKYVSWLNAGLQIQYLTPTQPLGDDFSEWKSNIRALIDLGRVNLAESESQLDELAWKHNLTLINNEVSIAMKGIAWGEANLDTIDFTDMIYIPVKRNVRMPQFDWVFIDECQDLNAAQRNLFLKCRKPNGRFVAVGDPRQAIYGFAGADVASFNLLKDIPNTKCLPLSVCYRCDESIINLAKSIVPQIEARPGASMGIVDNDGKIADVSDGDMILCRVTAPLVSLCMKYISSGVKAYVKGRDIGKNLVNMIKKTKKANMTDVFTKLDCELELIAKGVVKRTGCTAIEAKESAQYKNHLDKITAINVLADGLKTADAVINRINTIFDDDRKNGICLSTIHKSKGLESDNVYIICQNKFYLKQCMKVQWMAEQENNLVYVAYTRAKHKLSFIQDFDFE